MRPIEEREAILNMYFHEGLGYKAIAKMTELTPSTVKSICHRYRLASLCLSFRSSVRWQLFTRNLPL